jgi:hypothetical protein
MRISLFSRGPFVFYLSFWGTGAEKTPDSGFKLNRSRLTLSKISGTIRTFVHRQIVGRIKTSSIKRDKTNAWCVIFTTEQVRLYEMPIVRSREKG